MEFLLSWLADHVDLTSVLPRLRPGAPPGGEAWSPEELHPLGERLTAIGFAVEAYPGADAAGDRREVLDLEVTSNRPDAMCHRGLARELAVKLGVPLRAPAIPVYGSSASAGRTGRVVLEDPEGCPRYVARIVRGVRVGPSPRWLATRLAALGIEPRNNVVDATNYVLWDLGQPLHAFDLAALPGGEIRVRRARAGERLTTLDGVERELDPEILVIADRVRAVALAGVMGGLSTRITEATTDVLLESAHFERRRIRAAARRLGLHTDASHRFERGADFAVCDEASRRCAALIVELAGGTVEEPGVDAVAAAPPEVAWELDARALERFAGLAVGDGECEGILAGLGFAPRRAGERRWEGVVPSWRAVDFEPRRGGGPPRAYGQDVFEEVLRHVGLARIPATLPTLGGADAGSGAAEHERGRWLRDRLAGLGFAEAISYAFHDRAWDEAYPAAAGGAAPLVLANPLSERLAVLRRSLVPNLVAAAELNARRGAAGVALFELGHLFAGGEGDEPEAVAAVWGGGASGPWDGQPEPDLLSLKGVAELLLDGLGARPALRAAELPGIAAGTGAEWRAADGLLVGWLGTVARAETPFALHAVELVVGRLPATSGAPPAVEPPPRLPGIAADLTLTHAEELSWAELEAAIAERRHALLAGWRLKERYRGPGVPAGAVATTITFDYHGGERSLTQDEVNALQLELARELERRFGVSREEGA